MKIIKILLLLTPVLLFMMACNNGSIDKGPLAGFILHAAENGLPVDYLEMINEKISLRYRARPAYSNRAIYLTESFSGEGLFLPFYRLDSFEISSVFHEGFHAYVDIIIRKGDCPEDERTAFYNIMEESLDYYKETADGRKILWKNYRMQAAEEAMAIQITNLIKYRIVYEKMSEKTARNYIYGSIDELQMREEIFQINRLWQEVIDGKKSRGYYNKGFLRWKFPHIIDAKGYITENENDFVKKYILPDICTPINKPLLTDFIIACREYELPYEYLIDINKNYLWNEDMIPDSYEEMTPEKISQIYAMAFNIYWEMILKRNLASNLDERTIFDDMLDAARKWYGDPESDIEIIDEIIRNAAIEYIENIIFEKIGRQNIIDGYSGADSGEFEKSWIDIIDGKDIHGYYLDKGAVIVVQKGMTIKEKKFILDFILTGIEQSF